jgi:hypothetical protein
MDGNDERYAGISDIIGIGQEHSKMAMTATAAGGGNGTSVGKQLAMQYLQCGVYWLAEEEHEWLVRKSEFRKRSYGAAF